MSQTVFAPEAESKRLAELTSSFAGVAVATVGDIIVDRYLTGAARRISAEAPVPIVEVDSDYINLGGAANVAANVMSLGGRAYLVGTVGVDEAAKSVTAKLHELDIPIDTIVRDPLKPTTTKLRLIANDQQVGRADFESTSPIGPDLEQQLLGVITSRLSTLRAVVLQDYNKGVLTPAVIRKVIDLCRQSGVIVTVDPKKDNFFEYQGVTLFKPNRRETEDCLGTRLRSEDEVYQACQTLKERLGCQSVAITLSEDGVALLDPDGNYHRLPAKVRAVHDTSGAGDTAISTITMALAAGATPLEAVTLGNYAAGAICEKLGVQPVTVADIVAAIDFHRQ